MGLVAGACGTGDPTSAAGYTVAATSGSGPTTTSSSGGDGGAGGQGGDGGQGGAGGK